VHRGTAKKLGAAAEQPREGNRGPSERPTTDSCHRRQRNKGESQHGEGRQRAAVPVSPVQGGAACFTSQAREVTGGVQPASGTPAFDGAHIAAGGATWRQIVRAGLQPLLPALNQMILPMFP